MSEEEEEAFEIVKNITKKDLLDCWDYGEKEFKAIQTILNLTEKQREEIKKNQKFKKDIVNLIMLWDKKELPENKMIIETLKTIMHEFSRLEDIEDRKIQVAVEFVEEKRDKYWKDKISTKIEELEEIADEDNLEEYAKIDILKEMLEENNND